MNVQQLVPPSGDRGDRFTVRVTGDALAQITSASFGGGVQVQSLAVVFDGELRIKIRIADDSPLGPRTLTLSTPTATAQFAGFSVT